MKKILLGYVTDEVANGINKYILLFLDAVKGKATVDLLTKSERLTNAEIFKEHGANEIYTVSRNRHPVRQYKEYEEILKNGYDLAYFNISEAFDCVGIRASKKAGVKTAVHSHSSDTEKGGKLIFATRILNSLCKNTVTKNTVHYTCSDLAARWLFTKKAFETDDYTTVYNAIDGKKFERNEEKRNEMRKKLGFENSLVLGNCARFCDSKNQIFLLDVLSLLKQRGEKAKLVLIGDGEEYFERVKETARAKNLADDVLFTGAINNVPDYMQSFDVFLLPSKKEGLAFVGNEAQFCLLPCVFSSAVTRQSKMSEKVSFLDLDAALWADEILKMKGVTNSLNENAKNFTKENQQKQLESIIE